MLLSIRMGDEQHLHTVWPFTLATLVLLPLLAFIATALWLLWMCF